MKYSKSLLLALSLLTLSRIALASAPPSQEENPGFYRLLSAIIRLLPYLTACLHSRLHSYC